MRLSLLLTLTSCLDVWLGMPLSGVLANNLYSPRCESLKPNTPPPNHKTYFLFPCLAQAHTCKACYTRESCAKGNGTALWTKGKILYLAPYSWMWALVSCNTLHWVSWSTMGEQMPVRKKSIVGITTRRLKPCCHYRPSLLHSEMNSPHCILTP